MKTKFRCYDTKNKKWLFGYDYPNLGGFNFPVGEVMLGGELESIRLEDWDHIDSMQFTGIKDINGKEIYEGDVVRHNGYIKPKELEVRFLDGAFCLGIDEIGISEISSWVTIRDAMVQARRNVGDLKLEIIGNKYDNPELLK